MLECLILGDSIAVGVSQVKIECAVQAKVGISSDAFEKNFSSLKESKLVIISLGTNDTAATHTVFSLRKIRAPLKTERVVWLLPNKDVKPDQHALVLQVATEFNDQTINTNQVQLENDTLRHPTALGYKTLSKLIE
jgi:hypothetical protein